MRTRMLFIAFSICAGLATTIQAEEKAVGILFGPAGAEAALKAAGATAARAQEWLKTPGTAVELRRTGARDGQEILKFMTPKAVDDAFADAAKLAGAASPDRFLDSLDMAVYALARRPGTRILIVGLELPATNDDLSSRLKQTLETCQSRKVQVLVWDLTAGGAKDGTAWQALAAGSGGALGRELPQLEARFPAGPPPAVQAAKAAAPAAREGPVVYAHLFRSAPATARRSGSTLAPMSGLFMTETPMASLRFQVQGSNATARVRIKQAVKSKNGENVWQAEKEITVRSPAARLDTRKTGSLCYARQLTLTAGEYTLESSVEDLHTELTSTTKATLTATDSLPGLAASGALFVRKLNKQADVYEGDEVLQYEGTALTPMLNPVFPAGTPFELPVFFLVYPDTNGKRPEMRLDILQNGEMVGGTALAFTENLRDDARSGGGGISGEQKHEYPYLAKLANALLMAGNYEVKLTIRQDRQEIVRRGTFRVAEGAR